MTRDDEYRRDHAEIERHAGPHYLTGLAFAAFLLLTLFGVALSCAPAGRL